MVISVAIDGPSGAGKSTLARALAEKLGYIYVDTGALYRTVALAVLRDGKNPKDAGDVQTVLENVAVSLGYAEGEQRVFLGGEDVSEAIREEKVSMAASDVSAHPPVRAFLLETQRKMARESNVIMDGRDIGTVVLPQAQVKIFLTASVEKRAMRRCKQLQDKGMPADIEIIRKDVEARDYNDTHREIAPLKQAEDAVLVDTSELDFDQSLQQLEAIILEKSPESRKG